MKTVAVLFLFFFFSIYVSREMDTQLKGGIIRVFGFNSKGADYPPSKLLLKPPERWRKKVDK